MSTWPEAEIFYGIAWNSDIEMDHDALENLVKELGYDHLLEVFGHGHLEHAWGTLIRARGHGGTVLAGAVSAVPAIYPPSPELAAAFAAVLARLGADPELHYGWLLVCHYI